jgi:hypothetical protein
MFVLWLISKTTDALQRKIMGRIWTLLKDPQNLAVIAALAGGLVFYGRKSLRPNPQSLPRRLPSRHLVNKLPRRAGLPSVRPVKTKLVLGIRWPQSPDPAK